MCEIRWCLLSVKGANTLQRPTWWRISAGVVLRLAGAARMGEVRIVGHITLLGFCCSSSRFAGAALPGEVRIVGCLAVSAGCYSGEPDRVGEVRADCVVTSGFCYSMVHILRNWHIWGGRAGWLSSIMHDEGI